mmetsp:Transcript_119375/g.338507  ORF Transcript_119375/g.338507 Transcript_119375/m.338507 type:complete len:210 (+) Transcript_119375:895-1524(+)
MLTTGIPGHVHRMAPMISSLLGRRILRQLTTWQKTGDRILMTLVEYNDILLEKSSHAGTYRRLVPNLKEGVSVRPSGRGPSNQTLTGAMKLRIGMEQLTPAMRRVVQVHITTHTRTSLTQGYKIYPLMSLLQQLGSSRGCDAVSMLCMQCLTPCALNKQMVMNTSQCCVPLSGASTSSTSTTWKGFAKILTLVMSRITATGSHWSACSH